MGPDHASPTPNGQGRLTSSKTGTFYFAFGSNLSSRQMSIRLTNDPSSSVPVALARLDNCKWIICERGYANVVPTALPSSNSGIANDSTNGMAVDGDGDGDGDDGSVVWGIIYNMSPADEAVLDRYEGHDEWRNPTPEINPNVEERAWKPLLQGAWDYNKHYLPVTVTKWLRDPGDYNVETDKRVQQMVITVLVYVDEQRTSPGTINAEYIGRMNRGIKESVSLGLPESWVGKVMRRWIPQDIFVDDEGYVGTDRGYVEAEATETLDDVKERVVKEWRGRQEERERN